MALTIGGKTVDPLLVTDGQSLAPYKGVTVADTGSLASTETVSITLSQTLTTNGLPGPNFSYYPIVTDLGSISDPNGGGTFNPTTNTFTESGVVGGDPTFATNLLRRLLYNAPSLSNGQAFATQASITISNGAVTATDPTPVIVGDVAPPAIDGTVAEQPIASGDKIPPFATAHINSGYFRYSYYTITGFNPFAVYTYGASYNYTARDTAAIIITDDGKATDADGLLTGPGLSKTGAGTYSIANTMGDPPALPGRQ
jgi:hypothetical protein